MKPLRIERMGEDVQGVRLQGDPHIQPEPIYFRVKFPGGDVDVTRCEDGSYWVHVRTDGRLDVIGKPTSEVNVGDFSSPDLYHLAVRVQPLRATSNAPESARS